MPRVHHVRQVPPRGAGLVPRNPGPLRELRHRGHQPQSPDILSALVMLGLDRAEGAGQRVQQALGGGDRAVVGQLDRVPVRLVAAEGRRGHRVPEVYEVEAVRHPVVVQRLERVIADLRGPERHEAERDTRQEEATLRARGKGRGYRETSGWAKRTSFRSRADQAALQGCATRIRSEQVLPGPQALQ